MGLDVSRPHPLNPALGGMKNKVIKKISGKNPLFCPEKFHCFLSPDRTYNR
jgi:hypothetical protein